MKPDVYVFTGQNPEGHKYFRKVKIKKSKPTEVPPEPEIPNDFLKLSKTRIIQGHGSTQAAHIAEALEEKEK